MTSRRPYLRSSSFIMALLFTVLLSAAAAVLSYSLYNAGREGFIRETEAAIDARIAGILLAQELSPDLRLEDVLSTDLAHGPGTYYLYIAADGTYLGGDLRLLPSHVQTLTEGLIRFRLSPDILLDPQRPEAGNRVAAKIHTFADGRTLMIMRDNEDNIRRLERTRLLSVLSMVFMLLVILVSFFISTFVVSRINRIASAADEVIRTGDLSRRIGIETRWDDLSHLANLLNRLLDRIEELVQGVKSVSDNIAHDLRTPLTRLRNQLEQLRDGPPNPAQVERLIGEADYLLETFSALLRIARLDGSKQALHTGTVWLHALVEDVRDLYAPVAEDRQLSLHVAAECVSMTGDKDLLFQLVTNLVDNAIKFTPPGGSISLRCGPCEQGAELIVQDNGPGIPEAERSRVFERFYRGEASRTTRGSGLGLSLVKVVVELHHGSIDLSDAAPGLRVRVYFPTKA